MRPSAFLLPAALLVGFVTTPLGAQPATATKPPSAQNKQQAAHDDHGTPPAPERMHRYDRQDVVVQDFAAEGYVLDLGGGGEGVIGQLKPRQVVAIDLSARELLGAPAGPLKIVMDATDLKFLDESFDTVTSFFTLMYMKPADQERAIREAFRVLAPGGCFRVWDVVLPARFDPVKDIAVFPLRIHLPGQRVIETGYGTFFPDVPHDLRYFTTLLQGAGFEVSTSAESGRTLRIEARKPRQAS